MSSTRKSTINFSYKEGAPLHFSSAFTQDPANCSADPDERLEARNKRLKVIKPPN